MKRIARIVILIFSLVLSSQSYAQIRVACIGNSITEGFGLEHPEKEAYPAILQNLFDQNYSPQTVEVKNYGISGRTLLINGDLPWRKEPYFDAVLNYNPNYIIIKLGTNDTKPYNWDKHGNEFETDLITLVAMLQSLPITPHIILCTPIPVYENGWGIRDEILVNEIIPIITSVANKFNLQLVDLHSNMAKNLYLPDNVHPNVEGSKVIAQKIFDAVFKNGIEPNYIKTTK